MRRTNGGPAARGARAREQGGYVLPMFALLLTVLMAFAGFGVDVWNWWYNAQRMQAAADAAALAGVVYMPSDLPAAQAAARDVALANGYSAGSVTPSQGSRANRLDVEVTGTVENHFVSLLGIETTQITRDAEAEYTGEIETGSPINQGGNQPISTGDTQWSGASSEAEATNPEVWWQIAGSQNSKENGDRYTAGTCASANFACSGGSNAEYTANGYFYTIRLNVTDVNQALLVDVYDPAFVQSGDNCTDFAGGVAGADNTTIRNALAALGDRYNSNDSSLNDTYCTGDHRITSATYGTGTPTVQFRTAGPDATPWTDTDNFTNNPIAACDGTDTSHGNYPVVANQFRPYGSVGSPETPQNLATQISTANTYASRVYHRWVRVCAVTLGSIGITSPGEYDLGFNTRITAAGTAGHNRFAVRAALGALPTSTAASGANVSFFAAGPMPLYQNATASTAAFYLARVLPGSVNRILRLEFFDTGDGGGSGTITIVPPPEYASSFSGCTASGSGTTQPSINSSCALTGVAANSTYQGQRIQVSIPIPDNYDCDENTATGCWVRVRFNWSTGVQDTTTWRASIVGDPVRLTE